MKAFSNISSPNLQWQKGPKNSFYLLDGEEIIATLKLKGSYSTTAVAETATGSWTFARKGFFTPRIVVKQQGNENEYALIKPVYRREKTVYINGQPTYFWKYDKAHQKFMAFTDANGQYLLWCKLHAGVFKFEGKLEINPEAIFVRELPLLVVLAWYLVVLKNNDDEVGAIAAISASA